MRCSFGLFLHFSRALCLGDLQCSVECSLVCQTRNTLSLSRSYHHPLLAFFYTCIASFAFVASLCNEYACFRTTLLSSFRHWRVVEIYSSIVLNRGLRLNPTRKTTLTVLCLTIVLKGGSHGRHLVIGRYICPYWSSFQQSVAKKAI